MSLYLSAMHLTFDSLLPVAHERYCHIRTSHRFIYKRILHTHIALRFHVIKMFIRIWRRCPNSVYSLSLNIHMMSIRADMFLKQHTDMLFKNLPQPPRTLQSMSLSNILKILPVYGALR